MEKKKTKTIVKGVRASQEFFDKCDLVAKSQNTDKNKLIVRVMSEYCDLYLEFKNIDFVDFKDFPNIEVIRNKLAEKVENGGVPKSGNIFIHGDSEPELICSTEKCDVSVTPLSSEELFEKLKSWEESVFEDRLNKKRTKK